jgi:large subunit ribosomal protein L32
MGALPKRKLSKGKRGRRRQHDRAVPATLVPCGNCGELKRAHAVCTSCGYYGDREVIEKGE